MRIARHDVAVPARTSRSVHEAPLRSEIQILENPISGQDPKLGAEVEAEVRTVLGGEGLGTLQVRFRVCRDEADGIKFICKVENPPVVPGDGRGAGWRWWSPLLESAGEFHAALEEAVRVRRSRLASGSLYLAY